MRWLVCVIDWFAFWLVLWFYFVDCHSLCVARLFSRLSLSLFVSPWFRKSCGDYTVLRVGFIMDLFNAFNMGASRVLFWRYALLRLTTISFRGCVLVPGGCDACFHLLPCGGVCSVRLTRAKPKARQALQRLPALSLLPRLHQLSRRVRLREVSP